MTSDSPPFAVRPAESADENQWRELFLAYGVFYGRSFENDAVSRVWGWLMDDTHSVSGWVAHDGDTLLGIAHLRHQEDTFAAGSSWFLDDLFTSPDARGRGVATAIIGALKGFVGENGGGLLRWITDADNAQAQRLCDTLATRTSWVVYEQEIEASTHAGRK